MPENIPTLFLVATRKYNVLLLLTYIRIYKFSILNKYMMFQKGMLNNLLISTLMAIRIHPQKQLRKYNKIVDGLINLKNHHVSH